jgi:hypothetical protein
LSNIKQSSSARPTHHCQQTIDYRYQDSNIIQHHPSSSNTDHQYSDSHVLTIIKPFDENTKYGNMLTPTSVIVLWLAISCGTCVSLLPYDNVITGNWIVIALIFFNNLNIFIAFCEICLGLYTQFIQDDYKRKLEKYGKSGNLLNGALEWLNMPLTLKQVFDLKTWAMMWSTYALIDPSYQNHESFGFFIDVGNGWTTLPPCILLNYAMVNPLAVSPLLVGCVTIASYWQMFYGTIIYFASYLFNKRYEGKNLGVYVLVFTSNGTWMLFPAIAIYSAVLILRDGNMEVFGPK